MNPMNLQSTRTRIYQTLINSITVTPCWNAPLVKLFWGWHFSSANYHEAIVILQKRFGNKQKIAQHIDVLLNLEAVTSPNNLRALRYLYDLTESRTKLEIPRSGTFLLWKHCPLTYDLLSAERYPSLIGAWTRFLRSLKRRLPHESELSRSELYQGLVIALAYHRHHNKVRNVVHLLLL
jgi:hypothetical protein